MIRIAALSDIHNRYIYLKVPECDLLIVAGDWTSLGHEYEVRNFAKWLNNQTLAKHIVAIPGNHELNFEQQLPASKLWFTEECPRAHLLIDEAITIEGIKIYGSPITPWFCNWAWNKYPGEGIQKYWDAIPDDTQILITHGPPNGILDETTYASGELRPGHLGCYQLAKRIEQLKDLDLHFFGHIHASHGQKHVNGVSYYNVCICDETYFPSQPITIVEYEKV